MSLLSNFIKRFDSPYPDSNENFDNFDVNNINASQMQALRTDVYGGFKKMLSGSARYEWRGAGSGRARRQTGYHAPGTNFGYYNSHAGWSAVRNKLGIDEVKNTSEISRMYDFVNGYKPPAAVAPAAPAAPAPLMPTISDASKKYRAETEEKLAAIDKKITDFDVSKAAADKAKEIAEQTRLRSEQARITGIQTAAANQGRSDQAPNLQIQPASSTPKTAGTNAFRIRKRRGSNQNQLASSLNIGQSNTLNI